MATNNNIPNITMTVIFEGSALNRNEKIGGNILSVKKLKVNGEEKSFLSKGAIRHYLFNTLIRSYNWKEAQIIQDGQVLQFDIKSDDILSCQELDVFGYMNTKYGQTRKTPLHITKAISLFPYEQDMGMYANHDLVRRAKEQGIIDSDANPNPFNKEEHTSFYKITFTIDADKLGVDKWIVPKAEIIDNCVVLKSVGKSKKETESEASAEETDKTSDKKKDKKEKAPEEDILRSVPIKAEIEKNKKYEVENGNIQFEQLQNKKFRVAFQLNEVEKAKRINAILNTVQSGLIAHTSSESNTIVPMFIIIGDVKVPSPVFHPFIDVRKNNEKVFEVTGIKDALKNNWLRGNIFIQDCERLKKSERMDVPNNIKVKETWQNFLNSVLPQN